MAKAPSESEITFSCNPRSEWAIAGSDLITRGEERFSPTHQDESERKRFVGLFEGLDSHDQIRIIRQLGCEEILDGIPQDERRRSMVLSRELALWLERNNDVVEHRNGREVRRAGNLDDVPWDGHPEFRRGYLDELVDELDGRAGGRPERLSAREIALADIHKRSGRARQSRRNSEQDIHQTFGGSDGWRYVTVTRPPRGGEVPAEVREAWVGVSLPVPPVPEGRQGEVEPQEPEQETGAGYRTWEIWYTDAIVALLADGKPEAAEYWMRKLPDQRNGGVLVFAELDCKLRGAPVFLGRQPALAA